MPDGERQGKHGAASCEGVVPTYRTESQELQTDFRVSFIVSHANWNQRTDGKRLIG